MEKTVIKPGIVLIKKDGIIYELDKRTFQTIKALVFDAECDLCKLCRNTKCKGIRQIDDSFITDALTLKSKENCDHVFGCINFNEEEDNYAKRLVWFGPYDEDLSDEEKTKRHYGDAHVHHLAHPTVARHIDSM